MGVLTGLYPERVYTYFEQLCAIPRNSDSTEEAARWLMDFGAAHDLEASMDGAGNVILKKPGSPGHEQAAPLILQGHCDMVCEKKEGSPHDFGRDPIQPVLDGDMIRAKDTTLGGDDGIAVAMMLAVLEDDSLVRPPLEAVFTADEEIGMLGASALDFSALKGRRMLNLDSEEEGVLLAGCAGGMTACCRVPVRWNEVSADWYTVAVHGLTGGHSGSEIHKNRANASLLAGRLLYRLGEELDFALSSLTGGEKDNAIPRKAVMEIGISGEDRDHLLRIAEKLEKELRTEYRGSDGEITLTVTPSGAEVRPALDPVSLQKAVFWLSQVPGGVEKMSGQIPGLVETSSNPGIVRLEPDGFSAWVSVRSSLESARDALGARIAYLTEFLGGECHMEGVYPAWEFQEDSPFRDLVAAAFRKQYGREPSVEAIHAGLECGLFYAGIPGLECVSLGPDIRDIHTTEEAMSVPSVARTWELLLEILREAAES